MKQRLLQLLKLTGMGLDLIKYSEFLVDNGIEILAVATVEEAINLRQAGIEEDILMLSEVVSIEELELLIKNDIILTIGSLDEKNKIEELAKELNKIVRAHIKIDTGFARYGFLYTETDNILESVKTTNNIEIIGMYTHFSKAIDEKWTRIQFKRFEKCMELVKTNSENKLMFHCSNTTATLKYPDMKLDAVRIGSGIQGRVLNDFSNLKLKKVGILETEIVKIKQLPKGYNVSYSNEFKTKKETTVAVIPVGYMDGINVKNQRDSFSLKNNILSVLMEIKKVFKNNDFKVIIRNGYYNVVGRLGMYHTIIDVTGANIELKENVKLQVAPIYINSNIRREYI